MFAITIIFLFFPHVLAIISLLGFIPHFAFMPLFSPVSLQHLELTTVNFTLMMFALSF